MNNPQAQSQPPVERTNKYLAKAVYIANSHTDACRPAEGLRRIRNITSTAPMMQLIDLIRQQ